MISYYLGTHRFTPRAASYIELDWLDNKYMRWVEMLRLKNRIQSMSTSRWPRRVLQWDRVPGTQAWFREISFILHTAGLVTQQDIESETDLDWVSLHLQNQARNMWAVEALGKTKPRTFNKIHDFSETKHVVKTNLSRNQRSSIIKLKAGVLPIKLETGQFKGVKEHLRLCEVCKNGEVEDEMHYLYRCEPLQRVRDRFDIANHLDMKINEDIDECGYTKILLTDHLKYTAKWMEEMWRERRSLVYK